jgi:hypothetical protein
MKRAVSISLGSPTRDKCVQIQLKDQQIQVERIGTGGDEHRARQLFTELDGQVDALSVGGIDLYVRLDGRDYPIRAALKLVQGVHRTPLVDGRLLKYVLERRVFELAAPILGGKPHFQRAFMPSCVDRIGLVQAVSEVTDEVLIGDLMFYLGVPLAIRGLTWFKRVARILLPVAGFFPLAMLYPPGAKDEPLRPKYIHYWQQADLLAGDLHYIRKYSPPDLSGKTILTNTTTPENIEMLRARGVRQVITSTPRYDGRSFGVNLMEAVLTAYAGIGRPLQEAELDALIDELDLRPMILDLN